MHRFWRKYIGPIFDVVQPRKVLEIGAEFGWNTRHILAYCRANGCHADIVDPAPGPGFADTLAAYTASEYTYHSSTGLNAIPTIDPPDIALIDGDHNWHTVYNELLRIFERAATAGKPPPVTFLHDAAWPYARRDMYYAPDTIDMTQRQSYAYRGIMPGESDLTERGLNGHFANALHEGGPRNGVLTAIEDFVKSSRTKINFYRLPMFNGLAILVPEARQTPQLKSQIDSYFSVDGLLEALTALEEYSMLVRVDLVQAQAKLERRTDALARARKLMSEQANEIKALRAALASKTSTAPQYNP